MATARQTTQFSIQHFKLHLLSTLPAYPKPRLLGAMNFGKVEIDVLGQILPHSGVVHGVPGSQMLKYDTNLLH